LRAEARKSGPLGHFIVEFTAPAAGDWTWLMEPKPFGAAAFGTLTIAPVAPPTTVTPIVGSFAALSTVAFLRDGLRWFGLVLLLFAAGLGVWSQRVLLFRRQAAIREGAR
jgi:hypothetical protein